MSSFLLGPVYSAPGALNTSHLIAAITKNLSDTLRQTLENGQSSFGGFNGNLSSISITAVSVQQDENYPFLDFHFSSPYLNTSSGGTNNVTNASMYRIGSISKLFTVYSMLVNFGWQYWDDSVATFIPELRHAPHHTDKAIADVDWNEVTVRSLASQLSGIGRDYANGDLASQPLFASGVVLPELPLEDVPHCAGNSSLPPCSRNDYFQGLLKRHPVFSPQTTPVYSNVAFRLLGYVLETLSGSQYADLLQSSVFKPLGMTSTMAEIPSRRGSWVIPSGDSGWSEDMGDETPSSGIYSSSLDLARFGRSIMLNKQLSALDTRLWMKPNSHTASVYFSVGSPWEIWRTHSWINNNRTVDLYTKSGSIGQYNSQLVLLPDYGVTVSFLSAGPDSGSIVKIATEIVLQSLIPALEKTSIDEACQSVCGTYESTDATLNSSVEISSDGIGLLVTQWINQGVDLIDAINTYAAETGSAPIARIRLQATNLRSSHSVSYRALLEKDDSETTKTPRVMDTSGQNWQAVDAPTYGEIAIDDFIIYLGQTGVATKIKPRVVRDELCRIGNTTKDRD